MKYERLLCLSVFLNFLPVPLAVSSALEPAFDSENIPPHRPNHSLTVKEVKGLPFKRNLPSQAAGSSKKKKLEALPSLSNAMDTLKPFQKDIQEAYATAQSAALPPLYKGFKKLSYDESVWHQLGQRLDVKRWPAQQTWKQAVGGHLFFPGKQIYHYTESSYTEHLISRSDILKGCMLAGAFRHPLGLFYLGHTLIKMHWNEQVWESNSDEEDGEAIQFSRQLLAHAYKDLQLSLEDPDVFYSMGYGYLNDPVTHGRYSSLEALCVSLANKDLKSQFILLSLKHQARRVFTSPTLKEVLFLARKGFKAAYQLAADLAAEHNDKEQEITILKEAAAAQYAYAYVRLGEIEEDTSLLKDEDWYQKGIEANISEAFILKGNALIGDLKWRADKSRLFLASQEARQQAAEYFQQASKLNDPRGFEYLGRLKLKLFKHETSLDLQNELKHQAYEAFRQGYNLGCNECYWQLLKLTGKNEEEARTLIGPPPYETWQAFKGFLKKHGQLTFEGSRS